VEVLLAARRAFTFLSTSVDGAVTDAKLADRIMAARGFVESAAKVSRLFYELRKDVAQ
jgi:hypothetical protein